MATVAILQGAAGAYAFDAFQKTAVVPYVYDAAVPAIVNGAQVSRVRAAADVVQSLAVLQGWAMLGVLVQLLTPEGAAGNLSVGDGGNAARFINAQSLNGAAGALYNSDAVARYTYPADDTVDLTFSAICANAKFLVSFALQNMVVDDTVQA